MSDGSTADFEVSNPFKGAGTLKIRFARCKAAMVWAAWRRNLTRSLSELDNVPPTLAPEITHGYVPEASSDGRLLYHTYICLRLAAPCLPLSHR
ncbi:unnamed protein product [Zymoseptoria tritici ST99CH_1E4]|uniref:Uncharacterized protein n=1 Tax=Zymoseptoria tritici ST99CH_1E4 TaxID=1276532 RepID=A0A2H1H9Y1_ZYMTR|nr:unnamed protein product [Zymoseptoria tritici ST99CH_1E4]